MGEFYESDWNIMNIKIKNLIDSLKQGNKISLQDFTYILKNYNKEDFDYIKDIAQKLAIEKFGKRIYFRGIIEFSNYCKNDCIYCGIRRSNCNADRYRLTKDEILECCEEGYNFGYRTFVLQSGEDGHFDDDAMVDIVKSIREKYSDCAITLSIGEKSKSSYQKLYDAGANRFLLRHEAANKELYEKIHPSVQKWGERFRCLKDLKDIGYQVGAGMMVGVPNQTLEHLAEDLIFIQDFRPHMVGIGPFIPHKDTPYKDEKAGSIEVSLLCLSLVRIMLPNVLLPSTTALGTLEGTGRQQGVLHGCNVVMPNLSPMSVRKKYLLYDNKAGVDLDAKTSIETLRKQMEDIGYEVIVTRGDFKE